MKARRYLSHGCHAFMAHVINSNFKMKSVEDVPIVNKFLNVFPEELLGIPPESFFKCLPSELPEDVENKTLQIILELHFFKSSLFDLCIHHSSNLFSNPSYQQSNHIVSDYSHHFQLAIYSGVVSPLATRKVHVHG
ncbi:hypothetical protein Tco_0337371 [Tanacetum coccineum]